MGALNSLATLGLAVANTRSSEKAQTAQLADERDRQAANLLAKATEDQRQASLTLARRLAQERARAGASGTSSTGGSIDAVLNGLTVEANAERAASEAELQGRRKALESTYDARRKRNLLSNNDRLLNAGVRTLAGLTGGRRSLID